MLGRLFDGDDDAAVGGEGEGAIVVDLTDEVVLLAGGGVGRDGEGRYGGGGFCDGGVGRLAGEFLEPPGES